jgi:hypothetical protein
MVTWRTRGSFSAGRFASRLARSWNESPGGPSRSFAVAAATCRRFWSLPPGRARRSRPAGALGADADAEARSVSVRERSGRGGTVPAQTLRHTTGAQILLSTGEQPRREYGRRLGRGVPRSQARPSPAEAQLHARIEDRSAECWNRMGRGSAEAAQSVFPGFEFLSGDRVSRVASGCSGASQKRPRSRS